MITRGARSFLGAIVKNGDGGKYLASLQFVGVKGNCPLTLIGYMNHVCFELCKIFRTVGRFFKLLNARFSSLWFSCQSRRLRPNHPEAQLLTVTPLAFAGVDLPPRYWLVEALSFRQSRVFTIPDYSDARRRRIALTEEGKPEPPMSKFKLYYYSAGSAEIIEARWIRTRLALSSTILGMAILAVSFEANNILGDVLGLGFRQAEALRAENAGLRGQLSVFADRLRTLRETLASLNDQENEVRLLVDLPKVDADTRRAGIGGTDERIDHGVASDLNSQLNELRASLNSAERELQLEQKLWSDDVAKYKRNKTMYSCIPAIKPMQAYYSMTGFGMRFHPVYHVMRLHEGLDIANEVGTAVYATGDGVVVSAGSTSTGLGTMIVLNHGYGYTTVYGHLSKVLVHAGARVKRGDVIARSGESGVVTGPHLHFEVRLNGRLENPVDHFFDNFDPSKGGKQKAFSW